MLLSLDELIASIGKSISTAQGEMEEHSLMRFFEYFETVQENNTSTKSLKPKTVTMSLPSSEDLTNSCDVDIPISALVHHRPVSLDKVNVKVKARLSQEENILKADMGAPVSNECTGSSDPEGDVGEINLTFNVGDSSEGVARVVQNIMKTI